MAGPVTIPGDVNFRDGQVTFSGTLALPAAVVGDKQADPSNPIGTNKVRRRISARYAQPNGVSNVAETKEIHVVYGATGTVIAVRAGNITAPLAPSKTTVDVRKNGVSILTAAFDLTSATAAYALVNGAIATAALVAGDVLSVVITLTGGGTQAQGVFVDVIVDEDPQ